MGASLGHTDLLGSRWGRQPAKWGDHLDEVEEFKQTISELLKMHAKLSSPSIDKTEPANDLGAYLELAASEGRPEKLPFGVSPRGAELYVTKWLEYLDFKKIEVTPPRRDGGYDIEADEYVVEVKNWNRDWLPVSAVREIYGVATSLNKLSMVFSRGFLSEDARQFAEANSIPIFLFNAEEALLEPGNGHASNLMQMRITRKAFRLQRDFSKVFATGVGSLMIEFCNRMAQTIEALAALEVSGGESIFGGFATNLREMSVATEEFLSKPFEESAANLYQNVELPELKGPLSSPENFRLYTEILTANLVLEKAEHLYDQTKPLMEFIGKLQSE